MIAAAIRGALSDRARDGRVHVVSDLVPDGVPSTKRALAALAAVTTTDKVLVVLRRDDELAWLSLRNAVTVHVIAVDQLNAYDILVADEVVFTQSSLDTFIAGPSSGRSAKASARFSEAAEIATEPGTDELAAASVEESAEPSNADLAASAVTVAEVLEPSDDVTDPGEATVVEVAEPADPEEDAK
jgi:large subunit ribosomal protein L4